VAVRSLKVSAASLSSLCLPQPDTLGVIFQLVLVFDSFSNEELMANINAMGCLGSSEAIQSLRELEGSRVSLN